MHGTTLLLAKDSTRWTVVLDPRKETHTSPLLRFIPLTPVVSALEAVEILSPAREFLSTVAVDGFGEGQSQAETEVAGLGPVRICRVGEMQRPPAGWNHDGESDLKSLLHWIEYEKDFLEEGR